MESYPLTSYWAHQLLRAGLLSCIALVLYFSQRYWFVRGWRLARRLHHRGWRWFALGGLFLAGLAVAEGTLGRLFGARPRALPANVILGMWMGASVAALLLIESVRLVERLWARLCRRLRRNTSAADEAAIENPSRRYFFQTASYVAGVAPFVGAVYGFATERLRYEVDRVDVPLNRLPDALDGLRIAQLSDLHIGPYMSRRQIGRAVAMANDLGADLAVFTGDFLTFAGDPLEACIEELAALRAPLGVWGCLGNHEIYADVEACATELCRQAGIRILRRENAEVSWRGQAANLIGVDYQLSRLPNGRPAEMLQRVEPLVRRDVPNILLSHNPNAFPRAAELGIELTLAGHTHGGQITVEILDRRLTPIGFVTPYVAGLFARPLGAPGRWQPKTALLNAAAKEDGTGQQSFLYVNRGIGTVGAPVRLNAPPEITQITLRKA